jgi:hypothetical protein
MEKIKTFFTEDKTGIQIYSFLKTYIVIFIGIYYYGISEGGKEIFDLVFITEVASISFTAVIRNIWKLLTENNAR